MYKMTNYYLVTYVNLNVMPHDDIRVYNLRHSIDYK